MKGKVVCITGGANGIGKTLVEAFSRQGAYVEFLDKDNVNGTNLSKTLNSKGYSTRFHHVDVGSFNGVKEAFADKESPFRN